MNREEILIRNMQDVEKTLCSACLNSGRDRSRVRVMAVTKYAQDQDVLFLLKQGLITDVGESRVQQAGQRWTNPVFAKYKTTKHFIGHLQKNKAAKAVRLFDFIDSLDNEDTARAVDAKAQTLGKTIRGLVQVKLTERQTQSGLGLEDARRLAKALAALKHLKICGYMAIAPQTDDAETLRPLFRKLKEAFDQDFPEGTERYLSLGMSADFKAAVEEGSTLPRLGSVIFARNLEGL